MHYSICDFLSDIVHNSIESKASLIVVDIVEKEHALDVFVSDNGKGMDKETLKKVTDPFYTEKDKHPRRKMGLGLPFLKQAITQSGGIFEIDSDKEMGTSVHFRFDTKNIDTPPVGDTIGTFVSLMAYDGDHELVINYKNKGYTFSAERSALKGSLGDLTSVSSLKLMREYFLSASN